MVLDLLSIQTPGSLASDSGRCCSVRLNCQSSRKPKAGVQRRSKES